MRTACIVLLISIPCWSAQAPARQTEKIIERGDSHAVFSLGRDEVWAALLPVLAEAKFPVHTLDKDAGIVFLTTSPLLGDPAYLVTLASSRPVKSSDSWRAVTVGGNIQVKSLGRDETEVRLNITVAGCNGWNFLGRSSLSCSWENLPSSGYLERLTIEAVAKRLPEGRKYSERLYGPAASVSLDVKVLDQARTIVELLEKVEAANELGAGRDEILRRLVEARAALNKFEESPDTLVSFKSNAKSAIALYRQAVDDRTKLGEARNSFSAAKKDLQSYEKKGTDRPKKPRIGGAETIGPIIR